MGGADQPARPASGVPSSGAPCPATPANPPATAARVRTSGSKAPRRRRTSQPWPALNARTAPATTSACVQHLGCSPTRRLGTLRRQVEESFELARSSDVAAEVVVSLACPVVVTGPGHHQVQFLRDAAQRLSSLGVVVLVVHLDADQTGVPQGLEPGCVECAVVVPGGPWMRRNAPAARLGD